jgi:hypothetical protein
MNEKLSTLYSANWEKLCNELMLINTNDDLIIKPTNPLLIKIDEEKYKSSDIKIMIFGKETNDWRNKTETEMNQILELYDNFVNKGECWSYGGQFWNGVKRFILLLQEKYPNKKIDLVYNNIVKIGRLGDKGMSPSYIYDIEKNLFNLVKNEIEILNPNIVLFLSGPDYDNIIEDKISNIKFEEIPNFTKRQLSKVSIPNVDFAFRTYHPNYLWRNDINHYFNSIINKIEL